MKKYFLKLVRSPKQSIGSIRNARVFKRFAQKYDLVYFGNVDASKDEHHTVRGVSLAPTYLDKHYTVGNVQEQDLIAFERINTLHYPNHKEQDYIWWIIACPLGKKHIPHIYINGLRHKDIFYSNLFIKEPSFHKRVDAQHFGDLDHHFAVYAANNIENDTLRHYVDQPMIDVLRHTLPGHDIEVVDGQVLVMTHTKKPSVHVLEVMLKAALWLADDLNGK